LRRGDILSGKEIEERVSNQDIIEADKEYDFVGGE